MTAQLRFVILEHDHPMLHWDLMLENADALHTWRLYGFPETDVWIRAERLNDHRREYLTYEGPVSGNRGHVSRIASGTYAENPADPTVGKSRRLFELWDTDLATHAEIRETASSEVQWRFR